MGALVSFVEEPREIEAPPEDAIAAAEWLAAILREELHLIQTDRGLTTAARRELVLKYSAAITKATPNHELYEARKLLRDEEAELEGSQLTGKVSGAATSGARRLRSSSPRES